MGTLLSVSIALLAGLLMTRVFKPLKLPSVTAFLIAGVLIGPYCMGSLGIEGLGFNSHNAVSKIIANFRSSSGIHCIFNRERIQIKRSKKYRKAGFGCWCF